VERLIASPAVARERDWRAGTASVVRQLDTWTERQNDELGTDMRVALVADEEQLVIAMRHIWQLERVFHRKLAAAVDRHAQQRLAALRVEVHVDLVARHEVLSSEADDRIGRK